MTRLLPVRRTCLTLSAAPPRVQRSCIARAAKTASIAGCCPPSPLAACLDALIVAPANFVLFSCFLCFLYSLLLASVLCREDQQDARRSELLRVAYAACNVGNTVFITSVASYLQDERQEFTIERLQKLYDELRREMRPPRKRPSSLTVVDSVGHDDDSRKPHW